MANGPGLSDAELEVLKGLWELGPATVRQLNRELEERGRRWAYTTVATLLQRLAAKGFIAADASAVPHIYRAAVTRQEFLERRLREAADDLCDGEAAPLVLALVQGNRFTPEDLARFRRLLDEAAGQVAGPDAPADASKGPDKRRRT
jgi:predicted transcriptional regulator